MTKNRRPRGSGSIRKKDRALYLRYRPPGAKRQVEQHFPRLPNEGMKDYRERAEAELSKITLGLAAGTRVAPTARTIHDLAENYLASVETEVKGRTIDTYRATISNYIAPVLGSRKVSALTSDDIRAFKRSLLQRKVAGGNTMAVSTARRAMGQLHDLLNYAMDGQDVREYWGITFDPWPRKRFNWPDEREKPAPRTYAPYTVEETRTFLAACPEPMRVRFLTIILLMLRQGEFVAMRWKHLDENEGIYNVVDNYSRNHGFTTTKTASSQAPVPVPSLLLDALREHRKRQAEIRLRHAADWQDLEIIFPTRSGRPLGHCWYSDKIKDSIVTKAGVRPVSLHTFRKTGASILESLGVSRAETQEALRHKRVTVTDAYVAVYMKERRAHIEQLANLIMEGPVPHSSLKVG